jgi:pimeloyl-ACP methyl ester carboxylesterase
MAGENGQSGPVAEDRVRRDTLLPADSYRPPLLPSHSRLARIWADALKLDRVGIDDDFFALGGDSLAGTVICAEVSRLTGRKVAPSALVEASSITTFASVAEGDLRATAGQMLVPIRTTGERPPLVLIHGFDGQVLFVRRLAWLMSPDQPVYGIQARGMDGSTPHNDVKEMAADYASAIVKAVGNREIFLGGFCMGGVIAIEVLRHLLAAGGSARRLVLIDPPVEPRRRPREITERERKSFVRERVGILIDRFGEFTAGRPGVAEHYGEGGEGLTSALRVAESLVAAYFRYSPTWTRFPSTVLWSGDRAAQLKHAAHEYTLTRGPTSAHIVRNRRRTVTHSVLLRDGLPPIAMLLKHIMAGSPLEAPGEASAARAAE